LGPPLLPPIQGERAATKTNRWRCSIEYCPLWSMKQNPEVKISCSGDMTPQSGPKLFSRFYPLCTPEFITPTLFAPEVWRIHRITARWPPCKVIETEWAWGNPPLFNEFFSSYSNFRWRWGYPRPGGLCVLRERWNSDFVIGFDGDSVRADNEIIKAHAGCILGEK
jgi:hypothetical protein